MTHTEISYQQDNKSPLIELIIAALPDLSPDYVWELKANPVKSTNRREKFLLSVFKVDNNGALDHVCGYRFNTLDAKSIKAETDDMISSYPFIAPEPTFSAEELEAFGFYAATQANSSSHQ